MTGVNLAVVFITAVGAVVVSTIWYVMIADGRSVSSLQEQGGSLG